MQTASISTIPVIVARIPHASTSAGVGVPEWLDEDKIPTDKKYVHGGQTRIRTRARMCKVVTQRNELVSAYASPYEFIFERREVCTIEDLYALLKESARPDTAIVIGELAGQWVKNPMAKYRRLSTTHGGVIAKAPSRLLTIDIDGADILGFDPANPVFAVEAQVMSALGDGFKECGYVIQLTSSQRAEPASKANIRLWILMKDAFSFEGRRQLLKQLKNMVDLQIDPSSCNVCQVNYTSPPIVVSDKSLENIINPQPLPDILAQRWFLVPGDPLEIDERDFVMHQHDQGGKETQFKWFEPGQELLALETDNDEGIHDRIRSVTFSIAKNRPSMEVDEVVKQIRNRLLELSETGQILAHRRDRITPQALCEEIASAYKSALDKARLIVGPSNIVDETGVTLEWAQQAVSRIIRNKVEGITLLNVTVGVGKTHGALQEIKDENGPVFFYAPSHPKAEEVLRDARALGISVVHIKGRSQVDEHGQALCKKNKVIELHPGDKTSEHIGSRELCRDHRWSKIEKKFTEVKCPYFDECGYNKQFEQKASLYIFPHASLAHKKHKKIPDPTLTIIDEDPIGSLRIEECFTIEQLLAWSDAQTHYAINFMVHALQTPGGDLMTALLDYVDKNAHLAACDAKEFAFELVDDIASQAEKLLRYRRGNVRPDHDAQQALSTVEKKGVNSPWISLASVLRRGLETDARTSPEVRLEKHKQHSTQYITVRRIQAPQATLGKRTIILDATPNLPALKHIFGAINVHAFETKENLFEIQIIKPSFSNSALRAWTAQDHQDLSDLMEFFRLVSQDQTGAVITSKEFKKSIPASVPGYEMPIMTYGALRGQNAFKDRQELLLLGRLLIPAQAAEGDAAAFYPDIQPGNTEYHKAQAQYVVRKSGPNGKEVHQSIKANGIVWRHSDARIEHERRHRNVSEFTQAAGRLRAVRSEQKKLLINCSSEPSERPVDLLIEHMRETLGPSRLALLAGHMCGMVPLRAKFLYEAFPNQFDSLKSARRFVEEVRAWFYSSPRMFWMLVQERDGDGSEDGAWRRGSRGRSKELGEFLIVRKWSDIRSSEVLKRVMNSPQMGFVMKQKEVISDEGFLQESA